MTRGSVDHKSLKSQVRAKVVVALTIAFRVDLKNQYVNISAWSLEIGNQIILIFHTAVIEKMIAI